MKFSPEHNDNRMRIIYGGLVVCAFVMMCFGTGIVKTVLLSLSIVCLGIGLYFFLRYDMTTYTYITMEREQGIDFYVDKLTGKKSAYVCYYPLADAVGLEKYEKGVKAGLKEKHGKVFVYNYCHNKFTGDKYILTFKNEGYCDAVVIELDHKNYEYLTDAIKASQDENKSEK